MDATVEAKGEAGEITLAFDFHGPALDEAIAAVGEMPLPPYIAGKRGTDEQDRADYQTIYAEKEGAVAAPTAGLHFTPELMKRAARCWHFTGIRDAACGRRHLPAGEGRGHARPQDACRVGRGDGRHRASASRPRAPGAGASWRSARPRCACSKASGLEPFSGTTEIFITPGYRFRAVDLLITNFHLPKSTLFMLVSAFAGLERMRAAYAHAIANDYRFYSYGDCQPAIPRAMTTEFGFTLHGTDGAARLGTVHTLHGDIRTPAFMPVGTVGTVKGLYLDQVEGTGADIILGNTYHLMLRPGAEEVAKLGGLHKFIGWKRPILTDSGGFQIMSLSKIRKITEQAAMFQSHIDGRKYELSPERAMEIQRLLGSDIQMQLDQCIEYPHTEKDAEKAMQLSLRWAERSRKAFGRQPGRGNFGIVQGGINPSAAPRECRGAEVHRLRGLCHRRPGGGRGADADAARPSSITDPAPARGPAALPDGRGHAGGHSGIGGARHRHVRLRAADALRPPWPGLHPLRQDQPAQRQARR